MQRIRKALKEQLADAELKRVLAEVKIAELVAGAKAGEISLRAREDALREALAKYADEEDDDE